MARFDVFLSHSNADKPAVEAIARRLRELDVRAWLDRWEMVGGRTWQEEVETALADAACCAVFVGPGGFGGVHEEEMRIAIERQIALGKVGDEYRVIPVLLPGGSPNGVPAFLARRSWVTFTALDDEGALRTLLHAVRGTAPGPDAKAASVLGECPYRGLAYFDVEHADAFFGREALTAAIVARIEELGECRFIAIVGASGGGKSSLARAGVLAALRRDALPGSAAWPTTICFPGQRPLEALAAAIVATDGLGTGAAAADVPAALLVRQLADGLAADPTLLHLTAVAALGTRTDRCLLVLVDQFEEAFTLCADAKERTAFIDALLHAATVPGGRTIVVVTMRADFYGRCAEHPRLRDAMTLNQFLVGPMTRDELRAAIEKPATRQGAVFEEGLVDQLVDEVAATPAALPLMEHALAELWNREREGASRGAGDGRLSIAEFHAVGGLRGSLERRADAALAALTDVDRELCRRIFLRLVQIGEGAADTRRRVPLRELRSLSEDTTAIDRVLLALTDAHARLLGIGDVRDLGDDAPVEVIHETLIRNWPTLRKWIDADRQGLRLQRRLGEAANEWERSGPDAPRRDESRLYTGLRLEEAKAWSARPDASMTAMERLFLAASVAFAERRARDAAAVERQAAEDRVRVETAVSLAAMKDAQVQVEQRQSQRLRRLITAVLVLAALAGVLAVMAWRVARGAEGDRQAAVAARATAERLARITESYRLSESSRAELRNAPQAALLLAFESMRVVHQESDDWPMASREALHAALGRIHGLPLMPDGRPSTAVAISGDGTIAALALKRAPIAIVRIEPDGSFVTISRLDAGDAEVAALAISFDGQTIVAGSADGSLRVWRPARGDTPVFVDHLESGTLPVSLCDISRDGEVVAAAQRGGSSAIIVGDVEGTFRRLAVVANDRVPADRDSIPWGGAGVASLDLTNDGSLAAVAFPMMAKVVCREGGAWVTSSLEHGGASSGSDWFAGISAASSARVIVATTSDGTFRIWSRTGDGPPRWGVASDRTCPDSGPLEDVVLDGASQQAFALSYGGLVSTHIDGRPGESRCDVTSVVGGAAAIAVLSAGDMAVAIGTSSGSLALGPSDSIEIGFHAHDGAITSARASTGDVARLITRAQDGTVRLWLFDAPLVPTGWRTAGPQEEALVGTICPFDSEWEMRPAFKDADGRWNSRADASPDGAKLQLESAGFFRTICDLGDTGRFAILVDAHHVAIVDASGTESRRIVVPGHAVQSIASSRNGSHIAAMCADRRQATIFRVADDHAMTVVSRHAAFDRIVFDGDGPTFFAIDEQWAVRLFDVSTMESSPRAIQLTDGARGGLPRAIARSLDGRSVVVRMNRHHDHDEQTVFVRIPMARSELADAARRAMGRNFTGAEWDRYFPGQPYRKTFDDLADLSGE